MSPTAKTIEAVLVIVVSLGLGYFCRRRGWLNQEQSGKISRGGLTWLSPLVTCSVMWALRPVGWSAAFLPVVCTLCIVLMWPVAAALGRRLFSEPASRAPWVICAMFSNQGTTYGTFLCYIALGAQGAALASIFVLPFTPLIYLLGFFIAGRYLGENLSPGAVLLKAVRPGYSRNPLLGLLVGLSLLALVGRLPERLLPILDVLVPLDSAVQLFCIGVTLRFSVIGGYLRPIAVMHALKFLFTPLLGLGASLLLGLWGQAGNQLVQVVLIQASTPVAIWSLVVAQAAGLNLNLANSLWITTNLFAIAWAPVVLALARLLGKG